MNTRKFLRYLALGLGLLYAALMLLLAMDSIPMQWTLNETKGFLFHISPGIIIILASIYGSIRPLFGRYIFLLISVVYTLYYQTYKDVGTFMGISFPLIGITIILLLASLPEKK
jgi:hypothetical protein